MSIITSYQELAQVIKGKKILHLNSLGKDALVTLHWLNIATTCERIVSVYFAHQAGYPTDKKYLAYLKKRYPKTEFMEVVSIPEINEKMSGMLQSPLVLNHSIYGQEYEEFSFKKACEELRVKYGLDYICSGIACYEGMGRAIYLRKVGLLDESRKMIFPIGLMKQKQIQGMLKKIGTKLNPSYKFASESFDSASYFKMRYALQANPEYKKIVYDHYPMMALDEYRFEVLMKDKK